MNLDLLIYLLIKFLKEISFLSNLIYLIHRSGRKIFNGNLSFVCELSTSIHHTENVYLRKLIDLSILYNKDRQ